MPQTQETQEQKSLTPHRDALLAVMNSEISTPREKESAAKLLEFFATYILKGEPQIGDMWISYFLIAEKFGQMANEDPRRI